MRKKLLFAIICIALLLQLLLPALTAGAAGYDIVRVKLSVGTPKSLTVFLDGNYSVAGIPLERQIYTVKLESKKLNLYLGNSKIASGSGIYLTRHAVPEGDNNYMWLFNTRYNRYLRYLGDMNFSISGDAIQAVNHVYIEDYLYGVVPFEIGDSSPAEALKAQAVAARNYTARCMNGSGSYDLTDMSSVNQVYRGYYPGKANSIAAVDATAGQVMKYGSTIITAYYSASNGGWTELPYHRWGGGANWQYYRVAYDPYDIANPSSRYETITIPAVIDGEHPVTTSTNCSGTINADNAVKLIKQTILDSGQLDSYNVKTINDFTLTGVTDFYTRIYDTDNGQDHGRTQDLDNDGSPDPNLCMDKVKALGIFTVSADGTSVTVTNIGFDLRELKSNGSYPAFFAASLGLFAIEPVYDSEGALTAYNLSMRRFGHALGLSQRGAQQRAKPAEEGGAAQTYDQILAFYYPGTSLESLGSSRPVLTESPSKDYLNATVTDTVNVHSGPGSDSGTLGSLPAEMRVEVTIPFYSSTWHQINYGGTTAYIHKDYLTLDAIMMYSTKYARMGGRLYVPDGTAPADLLANMTYSAGTAAIYDASGAPYAGEIVGTGAQVTLKDGENVIDSLTVIVRGDANGDGNISISDYTLARLDILSLKALEGIQRIGADVNLDGDISISDYTLMRLDILGLKDIN